MSGKSKKTESAWAVEPGEVLRVGPGFALADVDAAGTPGFNGRKEDSVAALAAGAGTLSELQELLFANSRAGGQRKVLLVLQAMDTAGKGGIVRHVVGAVDPQGVDLVAFKAPSEEERAHDFLWRIRKRLPASGLIGVFDRSHYEDVLIARVKKLSRADVIENRYDAINRFEQDLVANDTTLIKVMLQISSGEQKKRLAERLDRPDKHWKYNPDDIDERSRWAEYQDAYQIALERTSTEAAPWYVVPADKKWYARVAVQQLLITALTGLNLDWPAATFDVETEKARLAES